MFFCFMQTCHQTVSLQEDRGKVLFKHKSRCLWSHGLDEYWTLKPNEACKTFTMSNYLLIRLQDFFVPNFCHVDMGGILEKV